MYDFARQPKWLLSHLLVVALVGSMIVAGLWQLQRLSDRKATNELIEARADAEPMSLEAALQGERNADGSLGDVRYLKVEISGEYRDESIFIDNRSFEGAPGSWLATPFDVEGSGETVLVVRGFVGRATVLGGTEEELAAPTGAQTLTGLLQPGAGGGAFARDREGIAGISRPNVVAIAEYYDVAMANAFVQLEAPIEPLLTVVPRPDATNGPHLSYAVQWFVFSLIGIVGYPLILRRRANAPSSPGKTTAPGASSGDETRDDASSPSTLH